MAELVDASVLGTDRAICEGSSPFRPTIIYMKVTIENKKGLNKDVKVFVDKKTMNNYIDQKYEEIKGTVNLKGFRPGKVPREILKRQFGKAVFNEVLDKVLKDTSTKALEENKIKPAGQPKLDLKTFGEDKDLEYILSVTELPKVEVKSIEKIKFNDYKVKIDNKETDKRIQDIAKNQPNFKDATNESKAKEKDLVIFDYTATVDGKPFKGGEGSNTQLTLGKDLFLKGFDKQLIGVKKGEDKVVEAVLPENFPEKDLVNKKAKFECIISAIKNSEEVKEKNTEVNNKDLVNAVNLAFTRLEDIRNSYTLYRDLVITDIDGKIIANSNSDRRKEVLGMDVSEEEWFQKALQTKDGTEYFVQDISKSKLENTDSLIYSTALRAQGDEQGEVIGAMGVLFDFQGESQIILNDYLPVSDVGEIQDNWFSF